MRPSKGPRTSFDDVLLSLGRWTTQITIISHSMGGLVTRTFLSMYPGIMNQCVGAWVCPLAWHFLHN